jgi:hypothetical protein
METVNYGCNIFYDTGTWWQKLAADLSLYFDPRVKWLVGKKS